METKTELLIDYASRLKLGGLQEQLEAVIRQATESKCTHYQTSRDLPKSFISSGLLLPGC